MRVPLIAAAAAITLLGGVSNAQAATALFAGGCFWSVEANFDKVEGVTGTVSGFAGGSVEDPTYEQVIYFDTGHRETVEVTYDPEVVDFDTLMTVFWHSIDPTDASGQFCDKGQHYRTAVFALDDEQAAAAQASKTAIAQETGWDIATEILPEATFWAAGDEHQNFHIENAAHYQRYRVGCGRDNRLAELWGDRALWGTSENPF
ncbi:peptide-methionine (S)-S-oxide reductase MsrA [Pelagibacterium montanilacus]|uniref:peptide-methionine (S)-S-oxide reductase MsrA n=1 Tax=Pelagibacterium montanilacus TaxID=2185280 RepID=UPI000F8DFDD9|nr:peptide-methionine (S)-S-oxide reductase MsrA [Pelagibacterium montanilacus]